MNKLKSIRKLTTKDAVVRALGDFALVHVSMVVALLMSVLYAIHLGQGYRSAGLLGDLKHYYVRHFLLLSLSFPIVFAANGFYTRSRAYSTRYKAIMVARGVGIAALVFFFANYLLSRDSLISRSIALFFCVLVIVAIPAARVTKAVILTYSPGGGRPADGQGHGRVPVVGGAGYIGSMLVRALLAKGWKVRVLDNLVYGDSAIRELSGAEDFELVVGDCRNIQSAVAAVKDVDAIVHLAAIVGDPACDLDRQTALEINYAATRMLIEVAKGHGISRFVFTSSCSVYGAADLLMDELSPVLPVSLYGETKVDSEEALLSARSETFHPTILRLATVFGNSYRPRFDLVVNLLTAKAYQEGVITIYNGEQWRPFIHVHDVARAIVRVLESPLDVVSGEVYNVGDSRDNWRLSDLARKVGAVIPNTKVVHIDNSDRRNYRVSFDKIRSQLGFESTISIEDGIRELKLAFEQGKITDYSDIYYSNQRHLQASGSPSNTCDMDAQIMAAFAGSAAPRIQVQRAAN